MKGLSELPMYVRRRMDLSNVLNSMKKDIIRNSNGFPELPAYLAAKEIIPWHNDEGDDFNDDDYQKWVNVLTEYLVKTYGKEVQEYFDKVFSTKEGGGSFNNDGNKYVFLKHSERSGGSGFSEGYDTWGDLISKRGWWFPINWWEVKEKLDKISNGQITFMKPGDEHNTMGYYFSIIKKSNIQESIKKILREETKSSEEKFDKKAKWVKNIIYNLYDNISFIEQSTFNGKPLLIIYFDSDDTSANLESWFDEKISRDIEELTSGTLVVCPDWVFEWDFRKKNADVFINTKLMTT